MNEREAPAEAIGGIDGDDPRDATLRARDACLRAADAILASDWLARHDAALVAQARSDVWAEVLAIADEWDASLRREHGVGEEWTDWHSRALRAAASSHPTGDQTAPAPAGEEQRRER